MSATDRLAEIQARADAATDGPWAAHAFGYPGQEEPSSIVVHRGNFDWQAISDGEFVASMPMWDRQESDDADFIAHARTDVPALVAALRAVLAKCARVRQNNTGSDFRAGGIAAAGIIEHAVAAALGEAS